MATKENFTDLREDAVWRQTVHRCALPWLERPALAQLVFFNADLMVGMDVLHAWHLGCGRDLTLGLCFESALVAKDRVAYEDALCTWSFWRWPPAKEAGACNEAFEDLLFEIKHVGGIQTFYEGQPEPQEG